MILVLNGPPRCGKDTAAAIICKLVPYEEYKMSWPLKRSVQHIFGLNHKEIEHLEDNKDIKMEMLHGYSYRETQIHFAEDWIKPSYGSDHFGWVAVKKIQEMVRQDVVISDCGFVDELEPIKQMFPSKVGIIRISRDDTSFKGDSRTYLPDDIVDEHLITDIANKYDMEFYTLQLKRALEKWHIL